VWGSFIGSVNAYLLHAELCANAFCYSFMLVLHAVVPYKNVTAQRQVTSQCIIGPAATAAAASESAVH